MHKFEVDTAHRVTVSQRDKLYIKEKGTDLPFNYAVFITEAKHISIHNQSINDVSYTVVIVWDNDSNSVKGVYTNQKEAKEDIAELEKLTGIKSKMQGEMWLVSK